MSLNIPETGKKRVVIIGAGFAGLTLARKLVKSSFEVILLDKNNYHQFQPLFYQVATSGLEPSAISFPLRRVFQKMTHVHIRIATVHEIMPDKQQIMTSKGHLRYDYLIIAVGADTNFFGLTGIQEHAYPMKSVNEALFLRNTILQHYEEAVTETDPVARQALMNIVVVGGGPTGVEVSGALGEMKKYVLPKDYTELDFDQMNIYLVGSNPKLLPAMSDQAGEKSKKFLQDLGVKLLLGVAVSDFDGETVTLSDGETIQAKILIWGAGVKGNTVRGLPKDLIVRGNRIKVNKYNQVEGFDTIFAIGDIASLCDAEYPRGHPQVAQVAIQQGRLLSNNLRKLEAQKPLQPFEYKDLGSMATIGRNRAVVDLPKFRFQGIFAWYVWMFVHLISIIGVKNRLLIFINWAWNYLTYDQSLRLIIKPHTRKKKK